MTGVEELLRAIATGIALAIEFAAAILIAIGAVQALVLGMPRMLSRRHARGARRLMWTDFARWLVLALEFELGADIIRSAIAPTWTDIGQLGAIAVIRTFLNYFLERDLERIPKQQSAPPEMS